MMIIRNRFTTTLAAVFAALSLDSRAEVTLPPLFSDAMVLQRDRANAVWGWAAPGEEVSVTVGDRTSKAVTDKQGRWAVRLPPLAAGGPYELTVSGAQKRTFKNVLVGDVWVCAGQSNMEFGMNMTRNATQEIASADHPTIRLFTVGQTTALHPVETLSGQWSPCTPDTVKRGTWNGFSAVAYFFGRELQQHVNVPIGLIQCAWGSTPGEAWTSREALATLGPEFAPALAGLARVDEEVEAGTYDAQKLLTDWQARCGIRAKVSTLAFDASVWKTMHRLPHLWSSNDDPALHDFLGAVWFRKEIDLPAELAGKAAELHFGPLDDGDVTWVNGVKVGEAMNLAPRKYSVPPGLLRPGRNVIATWVINTGGAGGMAGKPEELSLRVAGADPISLAGDWQFQIQRPLDQIPVRLFAIRDNRSWPAALYNGMVAPLTRFGIKGAIWYQGEANVGRANQYRKLLPTLITDWRARWQQGDFPFLIVQLAGFGPSAGANPSDSALAELRESQAFAASALPNTGLVTAVDIGDPDELHPTNKLEVGRRLALVARAQVYHQAVAFSGPVFKSCHTEGGMLRITFDHAEGLHTKNGAILKGFAIAGADRVFRWADAAIAGDEVRLTSTQVPQPVAARYNWDASPQGSLCNDADLPAFPFRTDEW